jgi:hypothetical protein
MHAFSSVVKNDIEYLVQIPVVVSLLIVSEQLFSQHEPTYLVMVKQSKVEV